MRQPEVMRMIEEEKNKQEFKVRDRVQIKSLEEMVEEYGKISHEYIYPKEEHCGFNGGMKHLCGRTATISEKRGEFFTLNDWSNDEGKTDWYYRPYMLKHVNDTKLTFYGNVTILEKDSKRYTATCSDENYDREKGLLVCLAKANGMTWSDVERLLKESEQVSFMKIMKDCEKILNSVQRELATAFINIGKALGGNEDD